MKLTEPWRPEVSEKEAKLIERIKKSVSPGIQKNRIAQQAKERRRKDAEKLLELLGKNKRTNAGRNNNENDR
jgi:hypothetical protein